MTDFLQILISGIATGSIYALAAVGFTLIWQTSQTINFAQGEFVMLPAFFVLALMHGFGWPLIPSILAGLVLALLVLGLAFKWVVIDPLRKHGVLSIVISTIAVGILLKETVKEFYSAEAQPMPSLWPDRIFDVLGVRIGLQDVAILLISASAIIALQLLLTRTRTGRQMQAAAQNAQTAEILGINVQRMILYTFLINAALATLASVLISPIYLAKFSSGETLGLIAFIAAIVGGFNQVRGALAGGLLIGVIDNLTAAYLTVEYRSAPPLILLILIIMLRPQGLLGRKEERTV